MSQPNAHDVVEGAGRFGKKPNAHHNLLKNPEDTTDTQRPTSDMSRTYINLRSLLHSSYTFPGHVETGAFNNC